MFTHLGLIIFQLSWGKNLSYLMCLVPLNFGFISNECQRMQFNIKKRAWPYLSEK